MHALLRQATTADLVQLTEIAFEAKRHWGYPSSLIEQWSSSLTLNEQSLITMHVVLAEVAGSAEGFCGVISARSDCQLEHLWVRPRSMGSGLGRKLFEYAVGYARSQGAERLVIESDPNAEPFYVRMGAIRIGSIAAPIHGDANRILPVLEYRLGEVPDPVVSNQRAN